MDDQSENQAGSDMFTFPLANDADADNVDNDTGNISRQNKRGRDRSSEEDIDDNNSEVNTESDDGKWQKCSKSSSARRRKRRKRKHKSVPQQPEVNKCHSSLVSSDSDGALHRNVNISSVSTTEDFKLLDNFNNMYASARLFEKPPGGLRPIAIDGCNVAWGHGNDQEFSYKGIVLCADYFRARGHTVKAFVPRQHQNLIPREVVDELVKDELLVFTPSRHPGRQGKRITAYDDRFIVQYAVVTGGVVISNDNFNDLYDEQVSWRETITNRVLQHTWISKDILMFQLDPMGRKGHLCLDAFLKFPSSEDSVRSSGTTATATQDPVDSCNTETDCSDGDNLSGSD